jgi:hypothetical protein
MKIAREKIILQKIAKRTGLLEHECNFLRRGSRIASRSV